VPAISASSATHPIVVHLIQPSARPVTAAPEDQFTDDGRHVRTWRLAPRTQTGEIFPEPDTARTRGLAVRTSRPVAASPSGEAALSSQPIAHWVVRCAARSR
jgi:hypothetical protein